MNNNLKHNKRELIFKYIVDNPGIHQIEISRALNISPTTVNYHLRRLCKKGLLTKIKDNNYLRYYSSEKVGNFTKKVLNVLRQETACNIIIFLIGNTCASQKELSFHLEKHPSTIDFHLKKLIKMDIIKRFVAENEKIIIPRIKESKIIEHKPISNDVLYKLRNPTKLYDIILTNKKSLSKESKIDAIITIIEYANKRKYLDIIPDKTSKKKTFVDKTIEYINEFFPNPYYG